ncbi:MAG: hypothetical protein QMC67_02115 [Candidatus Wallbacteria bacterium]
MTLKTNISNVLFIFLFSIFLFLANIGCMEKGEIVNSEPQVTEYEKTLTINHYITLDGSAADGNPKELYTPYDLNFFYLDSTEVIGLRGGYFTAKGVKSYLKIMDLGDQKYENIIEVPAITDYKAVYKNVKNNVIYSDTTDGVTLLKLNHTYAFYKWTEQGGNYAKIMIDTIDPVNGCVKIRSLYQIRQGYNKFY